MPTAYGVSWMLPMVRGPVHCRCRVASGLAAIQPVALLPSRFCGRSAGTEPKVELAAMVSCGGLPEPRSSSSVLSAGPGTATAVADSGSAARTAW